MPRNTNPTIWSSEQGDLRKQAPTRAAAVSLPPARQTVHLHRDSKGRAGKGVTVLKGLALTPDDLSALARALKQSLGVGGAVKDGLIELQSQEREKIAEALRKLGYKVVITGG